MGTREDATREGYDQVADDYADMFFAELDGKPLDRALLRLIAEEAPGPVPVADVGCGPGHVARYLHGLGRRAVGIDLSPRMIAVARERAPDVPFQVGSMLALDAADGAWGGIVAFYSIVHLSADELPRAFSEMHRVLAPGGLLLLAFHVSAPPGMELDGDTIHAEEFLGHRVSFDARILDPATVSDLLERAGLVVEASIQRRPYLPVEPETRRAYLLARKPGDDQPGTAGES
jgi:SAM-dependent methyltransferase